MKDLVDFLEEVTDQESFLVFVKAMVADREEAVKLEKENPSDPYGEDINGWENWSIEHFLESAVACTEDCNKRDGIKNQEPTWYEFASFLYAGKIYE